MLLKHTRKIDPPHSAKSPRDGCREAGGHARRPEGALASPRGRSGWDRGPSAQGGSLVPEWVAPPGAEGSACSQPDGLMDRTGNFQPRGALTQEDRTGGIPETQEPPKRPQAGATVPEGLPHGGGGGTGLQPPGHVSSAWTGPRSTGPQARPPSKAPGETGWRVRRELCLI